MVCESYLHFSHKGNSQPTLRPLRGPRNPPLPAGGWDGGREGALPASEPARRLAFPPGPASSQIIGVLEALSKLLRTNTIVISNQNAKCSFLKGGFYSEGFIFQPFLLWVFLQKTFLHGCVFANVFI